MATNQPADEIDVLGLIKLIWQGISNLFVGAFRLLLLFLLAVRSFLLRYAVRLLGALLVGALLGAAFSLVLTPKFESSAVIHSAFLPGYSFETEIEKLDHYCRTGNYEELAGLFKLPKEKVETLKGISAHPFQNQVFIDPDNPKFDSLMQALNASATSFTVTIDLKTQDPDVDAIQLGLLEYLKSSPALQRNYNMHRRYLEVTKDKIELELSNFDSLKQLINRSLVLEGNNPEKRSGASLDISVRDQKDMLKDPLSVYEKDFDYFQRLVGIDNELLFDREVRVVSEFGKVRASKSGHVIKHIIYGAIGVLALFLVIVILMHFNSFLNQYESKISK